ncbi:YdhR family protein [bacterium]|nr:YdhR family protein [bacterium]
MSGRILQINFKFNVSRAEYEEAVAPLANEIDAVAGLRWKVWLMNEAESEAGGIYLFDDEASTKAYLEGPIVAQVVKHPALSDFSVKQFDVLENVTAITRGPVNV